MNSAPACPISKMDKILLVTDGSEFSEGAVREGIKFASMCSSEFYAIYVIQDNPEYEVVSPQSAIEMEEIARLHLLDVKSKATAAGVRCETIIGRSVEVHTSVVEEAIKRQINMIIIGRRGYKGLMKLLMGEVAARVIGHAPCKVLVVPRAAKFDCKDIVIASDGSKHSTAAAIEGIDIAKRCGGNVIAISSSISDEESYGAKKNVNEVIEAATKYNVAAEPATPRGKSYETIIAMAASRASGLIVMGSYGHTGLKKLFMGSSTEKVIGQAPCAVLVVNADSTY